MSDFDKKIQEALDAETIELLSELEEQGIFGQIGGLFKGKMGWFSIVTFIIGTVVTFAGLYAAWKFIVATDIPTMLRWAALAWALFQTQIMLKLWSWMRMETNRNIRETKRLELQIARLLARN